MVRDGRPVVVVTGVDDVTADLVIAELNTRNVSVVRFNPAELGEDLHVSARFGGGPLSGLLTTPSKALDLGRVRSLYYRRPAFPVFDGMPRQDAEFAKAQARAGLGGILENLPGCVYVNHPRANIAADFKPAQLQLAAQLGMRVPDTVITNSVREAHEFMSTHKEAIYKPLKSTDYEIEGEPVTIWTNTVTAGELDDTIAVTMHLFQEKIPKVADWRITVVGRHVFCVQINSPLLDWRYDYDAIKYSVVTPPDKLIKQLHTFLQHFGLAFGCFDFGVTAEGEPVFFEINPNGQWAWMEPVTDLPMTAAFADILQKGQVI